MAEDLLRTLLDQKNVHIRDPPATAAVFKRLIEGRASNLTVISDFDHTLTRSHAESGERCAVTHEVFGHPKRFPGLCETFALLEQKYARFEHLTEGEERVTMMEAWWRESGEAIANQGITRSELHELVGDTNIHMRDGAAKLLESLEQQEIPTLIFSAGIGDVISVFLERERGRIQENLHVVSNMIKYEQDRISGFSDPLIHCFNKSGAMIGETSPLRSLISTRPNVILLGDALGDCGMVEGLGKETGAVLKIGFLNKKPDLLSHFVAAFDIVIADDQTIEIPAMIMNMII